MIPEKVLITVKTYPILSEKHGELVCTAGLYEDNGVWKWIRIYPIPFRSKDYDQQYSKYDWIKLPLIKRDKNKDSRPESYQPSPIDADIAIVGNIDTAKDRKWAERKKIILNTKIYTNLTTLIQEAKDENICTSLATFKPTAITNFHIEEVDAEFDAKKIDAIKAQTMQSSIDFDIMNVKPTSFKGLEKLPYKFSYTFVDDAGRVATLMIEDWEIAMLYRNCLARHNKNKDIDDKERQEKALKDVRKKYVDYFLHKRDIYLYLGTTYTYHMKNAPNPFVIIGVFYPPLPEDQTAPLNNLPIQGDKSLKVKPLKVTDKKNKSKKKDSPQDNPDQPPLF